MSIIGIEYIVSSDERKTLCNSFKGFNMEKYTWRIVFDQTELVPITENGKLGFEAELYSGSDFEKEIIKEHYIIFMKLEAYRNSEVNITEIESYEDFIQSDCQLLLLINDVQFVEIYTKSQTELEILYDNALKIGFSGIRYITKETNERACFNVL